MSSSKSKSHNKGKSKVDTSQWNAWEWNENTQTEYRSRQMLSGEWEYEHREPEVRSNAQAQGPRTTPGDPASQYSNLKNNNQNFDRTQYSEDGEDDGNSYEYSAATNNPNGIPTTLPLAIQQPGINFSNSNSLSSSAPGYPPTRFPQNPAPTTYLPREADVERLGSQLQDVSLRASRRSFSQTQGRPPPPTRAATHEGSYLNVTENPLQEALRPEFKIHNARDFKRGRVLKTLWTEPRGQDLGRDAGGLTDVIAKTPAAFGQIAYTSIRRFAVVSKFPAHCVCIPILTYGHNGTKKKGHSVNDHAIVYVNDKKKPGPPRLLDGESKLTKNPIRMDPYTPRDKLDTRSRINFAKLYTVEFNTKVAFIGTIHDDSEKYFTRYFNSCHPVLPERFTLPRHIEEGTERGSSATTGSQFDTNRGPYEESAVYGEEPEYQQAGEQSNDQYYEQDYDSQA